MIKTNVYNVFTKKLTDKHEFEIKHLWYLQYHNRVTRLYRTFVNNKTIFSQLTSIVQMYFFFFLQLWFSNIKIIVIPRYFKI